MKFDFQAITGYFNLALVLLFVLFIGGVVIAAFRGLRRGVWKSTHNMVCMLSLVIIAFVTLDPLCKFVENFDLSPFIKGSFFIKENLGDGAFNTYWVPITSVKETVTEFIKGFYLTFNVSATTASAANFAFALAESVIKIVLFLVDIILIVTLGNLFSFITWYLIFQHFVPKIARKTVKVRWLGALETAATFVVLTALFFTPFTSLVNSLNQSYQRNKPKSDNETIVNIGNFVDAYNDSLFAKILFNWTVDGSGMTIDTRLFSTFTTGISEDVSISLVGELANLTNLIVIGASGVTSTDEGQFSYDPIGLISQEVIDGAFDVLSNSTLITSVLPLVADIALNSSMMDEFIPNRLIDVSDANWKEEIGYVQNMVDCLFDSGVMDKLIVYEDGKQKVRTLEGNDITSFIEEIVFDEQFDSILEIFKSIDDSRVLSRVVPAVMYYFTTADTTGQVGKYLPLSWEELSEFSWGYECYVLFDFLHKAATLDRDFIKAIMVKTSAYTPMEGEEVPTLESLISKHVDKFNELMVGKLDSEGKPVNVDKYGRTIVFKDGKRIEGRNYCLFDMKMIEKALPSVVDTLFELDFMKDLSKDVTENDINSYHGAVEKLKQGVILSNFKQEFGALLDIVGTVAKDEELLTALFSGQGLTPLMKESNNFFSIDSKHIEYFGDAFRKMDKSSLLYYGIVPIIKATINGVDVKGTLNDIGLKSEVIVSAIDHDMKKQSHTFFTDFASLLDNWSDLGKMQTLIDGNGGEDLIMDKFKDESLVDSLISILSVIWKNPLFNPTPEAGDTYEKNENLYSLLEFVFGQTANLGLKVERETLRKVETNGHTWDDEFGAIGNIIKYIANHDVTKAADMFNDGLSRSSILNLKEEGEGKVGLPRLFTLVNESYIFKSSLGPFLDDMLGDALSGFLTDKGSNVSFGNITNWAEEGQRISNLLDSLYNLIPENDAEAKNFLTNFDMSKLHDVVELNDMLHQLAYSGIFTYIDENNVQHYQFGRWFYQKINDSMVKFSVNATEYDLLADPKAADDATWSWKESWGIKPAADVTNPDPYFEEYRQTYNPEYALTATHMIAYRDFVYLGGKANTDSTLPTDWCNYVEFTTKQAAFLAAHKADLTNATSPYLTDNEWGAYFGSDAFISDYDEVFSCDEISRVCKFMTYSLRVIEKRTVGPNAGTQVPFNELPINVLDGLLTSINNTSSLRICLYNFYRVAAENLLNGYSAFNLSSAYNTYIVDANHDMFDFANSRPARQAELDKMIDFYKVIDKAKTKGVLVGSDFDYSKMNQDGFINDMKKAINDFNGSYIFHRSGSAKVNALTTFQGLFNSMLAQSSIKDVIYLGENSPKDQASTLYNSKESKIEYLVTSVFLTDQQISDQSLNFEEQRNRQANEINGLMDCVDSLYSLKKSDGTQATSINDADMNKSENVETIETLFTKLNNSELLYDALPNSIYNIFVQNDQLSIENGGEKVDFKRVDPFYHYYFNDHIERSTPNFNAKYLQKDITSIISLLTDYQEFNTQLDGKEMSDPATLKTLTGTGGALKSVLVDMHNSNLFHTPARNYEGLSPYYTNKYETGTGFTLFEEMMSKICSFVKLDTFAYDETFVDDVSNYGNASNKLVAKVNAVTLADDGQVSSTIYSVGEGTAWAHEIDSMMNLANTAAGLGSGSSLDVSNFELDKLAPADVKSMLTCVNASDLVGDAIPKFVKDGFTSIKLGTLTSYNDADYATYRLGQVAYGGADALASEGTEIDNIYNVMTSLYVGDHYIEGMDNLTNFVKTTEGQNGLRGLIKYLYCSRILNTNKNMVDGYDELYVVEGRELSARGALIVNALGNDLAQYIARDANSATPVANKLQQIERISQLLALDQYKDEEVKTYTVEAEGLITLITNSEGKINAESLSSDKLQTDDFRNNTKPALLTIISSSYNATNEANEVDYKRSVIASEFISGALNNVLENEYVKLDNVTNYPGYVYRLFSFANDVDDGVIKLEDYQTMGKIECDGLDGMIDALAQVKNLNSGLTPEQITALKNNFAKMGLENGKNSKIAQAIYLAEAHSKFKLLALVPNSRMEFFTPVNETSTNENEANNVYSNTFCFKEYGERVEAFLS